VMLGKVSGVDIFTQGCPLSKEFTA
jgi:hypothetical protein